MVREKRWYEKHEYQTKTLKNKTVRYEVNAKPKFTKLVNIPFVILLELHNGDFDEQSDTEKTLWQLFRKWEIVKFLEEECPDLKFKTTDPKLSLIRLWMDFGDPCSHKNELYVDRWEKFILSQYGS